MTHGRSYNIRILVLSHSNFPFFRQLYSHAEPFAVLRNLYCPTVTFFRIHTVLFQSRCSYCHRALFLSLKLSLPHRVFSQILLFVLVLPHRIFPKFMYLYCHSAFFPNTDVCTATQHFSQFRCTYCPTEFFPVKMSEFSHISVPKFLCLHYHTTFFHSSEICVATHHVSRYSNVFITIQFFPKFRCLYCHTIRFFHAAPVVKRGQSTKYQLYSRSKKLLCFNQNKCFEG